MRSFGPRLTDRLRVKRPRTKRIEYSSKRSSGFSSIANATRHWPNWDESRTRTLARSLSSQGSSLPFSSFTSVLPRNHRVSHCTSNDTANPAYASYLSQTRHNEHRMKSSTKTYRRIIQWKKKKHFFFFFLFLLYIFQGPVDWPTFFTTRIGMFHNMYNSNESRDCFMLG